MGQADCVWARRNDHRKRWLGERFSDFPFGSLEIPFTDKAETNSTFSIYSWQIQPGKTPKFQYHSARISYCFLRIFRAHATIQLSPKLSSFSIGYGGLLGTSWDQSIRTPWPCGHTHISTFLGCSGTLVPVTYAARECSTFGDLWSLAQSRRSRVCYCRERMESMCSFRQFWRLQKEIWGNETVLPATVRWGRETWQWDD